MNRADRRRAARKAGIDFAAQQRAERDTARLEAACLKLSPVAARKILAEWAAKPGRSQAEVDMMNAQASKAHAMNIRKIFKANCGPGAVYLGSELQQRGEYNTVAIQFEMVPEGRQFSLDGVIHDGDADAELERAVVKIATIAKNIRAHIDPDRPVVMHGN